MLPNETISISVGPYASNDLVARKSKKDEVALRSDARHGRKRLCRIRRNEIAYERWNRVLLIYSMSLYLPTYGLTHFSSNQPTFSNAVHSFDALFTSILQAC